MTYIHILYGVAITVGGLCTYILVCHWEQAIAKYKSWPKEAKMKIDILLAVIAMLLVTYFNNAG